MEENKEPNDNLQSNSNTQENEKINTVSNVQKTNEFNVSSQEQNKKKGKSKLPIIILAVLFIAIILGLIYYFVLYSKTEEVYRRLIETSIDSYAKQIEDYNYKTSKTSLKLDANVESNQVSKDVLDLINKTDIEIETQTDNEDKKIIVKLNADYDKEDLLNIQMYSDIEKEKTYIYLKDLLDKYIETDMDDEIYLTFKELLEAQKQTKDQQRALQKAIQILKEELTDIIKTQYCSNQKEDVTINNDTVNTTKNTVKMTIKQFKDEFLTVFNNLQKNDEFINCFEDKDDILDSLDMLIEQFEQIDDDENTQIEINIYNKGIRQETVKFEIKIYSEENNKSVRIAFTKTDDTTYYFEAFENDKEPLFKGTFNIEETSDDTAIIKIKIDIKEFGKVELNIDCTQKFNEDIEKVNVENSVKAQKLTTEEQSTLLNNLQNSKLFELIQNYAGLNSEF